MKLNEDGPGGIAGRSTRVISIKKLLPIEGLTAVDLGSNEGYNCFDLYEGGCNKVVGIEIRDRYLETAENENIKLGYKNIQFLKKDIRTIDKMGLDKFDICLCTGVLYHMQNPFNLLKRIRNVCKILILETHVAPSFLTYCFAKKKYRCNLSLLSKTVRLDGELFSGRLNRFPQCIDMNNTSGSVVSHTTFWPSKESLEKMIQLAGFQLRGIYYSATPKGFPEILVNHGFRRSKIFLVADVIDSNTNVPVEIGSIEGNHWLQKCC